MDAVTESTVGLADPRRDLARFEDQLVEAARRVIASGFYINGTEVRFFEETMGRALGLESPVVGVGSGTDALIMALLAAGIGSGDEVIVPSHTAGPSVAAIRAVLATPVFVDVEADTACVDPDCVAQAVSPRTKAILAVHLYGHPADMDRLKPIAKRHDLVLIEDCAQAQGALLHDRPVGSIGDLGCFSFYPTKNLGAIGDGGAVSGSKERLKIVRKLRTYGWSEPQYSDLALGRCSRLDEIQAAFLNVKFSTLDTDVKSRRRIAEIYKNRLSDLPIELPVERPGAYHAYHLFVVKTASRDPLREYLSRAGIMTGLHYPFPVHVQPGLSQGARTAGSLVVTLDLQAKILSLPLFVTMTDAEIERVVTSVQDFFRGRH
ncbi:DegT/DnrJ/EryC1/StrS family aminotransferase [Rhizobium sp. J15]|uniref:DegT/DnrJ/EryC1/StrS family aminotransferase n=1 Tax=Rhizobium sp. J15 TaxID=2035450 RepID=UPI001596640F|nr:DegT/DnrJ/EryC1/StrS family aminotransferase [Rhizobium sp. J15]